MSADDGFAAFTDLVAFRLADNDVGNLDSLLVFLAHIEPASMGANFRQLPFGSPPSAGLAL